jgi:hypothetical protein
MLDHNAPYLTLEIHYHASGCNQALANIWSIATITGDRERPDIPDQINWHCASVKFVLLYRKGQLNAQPLLYCLDEVCGSEGLEETVGWFEVRHSFDAHITKCLPKFSIKREFGNFHHI